MARADVASILFELTHLPPDVNPFDWLSAYLTTFFIPQYSGTAKIQLYLIISFHAVCVFIIAGSLYLRYRKGQLWLCRWQLSRTIIEPNLATVPACAAIIEMALFELLFMGVLEMMGNKFTPFYGYAILLVGVLPAIVGELVTWSVAVGFCLHCHKTFGSTPVVRRWTAVCNLGLVVPILHFAAFLPLNVLVGRSYRDAIKYYLEIEAYLAEQSPTWQPGTVFDIAALVPLVQIFATLETTFLRLTRLWRIAYTFHACAALLLILALGSIATLYLRSVGKVIQRARDEVNDSGRGGETLSRVQQTWTLLIIVLSIFIILATFSLCLSLYAATHPLETPQAYVFTSFWSSAILSTLCSSLLLLQTVIGVGISSEDDDGSDGEKPVPAPATAAAGRGRGGGRAVGFVHGTTRTGRKNLGVSRKWRGWWSAAWTRNVAKQPERAGATEPRVGVASINVLVEVFSRVDSIEGPEEASDEYKPRWSEPRSGPPPLSVE